MSLAIRTVLAYILFTDYNSPFTVTAIIKCIFDSELLHSVCLARSSARSLQTAKWIYLHDFLTFTDENYTCDISVMHWGKQNVSNALNSTDIFAVCHAGSIWSMIDIKGCLRISVHILVRLCELTLSFITALAPIYLLGYFKSGFGLKSLHFLRSP